MASTIEVNKLVTTFAFKLNKGEIRSYEATLKRLDKQGQTMAKNASKAMSQGLGATAKAMSSQFSSVFKRIQSQANNLKLNPKINIDNSSARAKIKEVDSMVNGLARRLGTLALGLGGLGLAKDFGGKLFEAVGTKQSNMSRLTTQMGSEKKAKEIYEWMRREAERTPFEKNELISGFSAVKGSGYQLTQADLEGLGNVTSGSKKQFPEMIEMLKSANRGLGMMVDNFDGMKAKSEDGKLKMDRFDKQLNKWVSQSFDPGDMKGIIGFVRTHGERNYQGEMERQSKTLPGLMSTFRDKIQSRFEDMGDSGMEKTMSRIMNGLVKFANDFEPKAKQLGAAMSKLIDNNLEMLPPILKGIAKFAPAAAFGIGLVATRMAGTQIMLGARALWSVVGALRGMSMLTLLGGWPMLIGAAAVAIGYLGYEVFKFATTGEGLIKNLSDKFPGFKDAVKLVGDEFNKLKPVLGEIWKNLTEITEQMLKDLGPVAKDMFENWFIPAVTKGLNAFAGFLKDWREGYKSLKIDLENARKAISGFGGDCVYWFENAKNTLNLFREVADSVLATFGKMYPVFKPIFEMLRKMVGWNNFGAEAQGTGPGGASAMLGGSLNQLGAAKISQAAKNVTAESGYCLWAIKQTLQAVYGDWKGAGAMSVSGYKGKFAPGGHAADFGPQLMQMGFKKIKVKSMDQMPDGGIAIYPRGVAGFSANSGHIEAFDKETNAFYYGRGAHNANSRKNSIQYADVYVPTGAGGRVTNAPNPQNQGLMQNGMLNPSITQNLYFNGNVNPQQTANGAGKGVDKALDFATAKYSYLTGK